MKKGRGKTEKKVDLRAGWVYNELSEKTKVLMEFEKIRRLLSCVRRAADDYDMIEEGDRIAVCISGGKDSFLLAKCMQDYKKRSPLHFELCFLCMDPGFDPLHRQEIEDNAHLLDIPIEFFRTDVFAASENYGGSPCMLCAKMRRGYLYRKAKEIGCNKIALGHHFDDAAETLLMSMLYSGQIRGMRPKLESDNVPGMELIRPLYHVREEDIVAWRDAFDLHFSDCACTVTKQKERLSTRQSVKEMLRTLDRENPDFSRNVFRSAFNVQLDSLNGWKKDGIEYSFTDDSDK